LLPIYLIIVRNHGDDEEDERDIKRMLERQVDVHIKLEIQSNLEFQSLTLSKTQNPGPPRLQIDVQGAYEIGFGHSTYAWKEDEIKSNSSRISEASSISRVQLVQELFTLKLMPRSHTTSNWGVLVLHGKVRRYNFEWNLSPIKIHQE
jgi:hypothetical protein